METYRSSGCPRWTASSSLRSCGGGGAFDHARQKRHSITHGSSQLRTCRRATGHDIETRSFSAAPFFPRLFTYGLGLRCWIHQCCFLLPDICPPAETEGAEDQLPMPSDGQVAPDLEV